MHAPADGIYYMGVEVTTCENNTGYVTLGVNNARKASAQCMAPLLTAGDTQSRENSAISSVNYYDIIAINLDRDSILHSFSRCLNVRQANMPFLHFFGIRLGPKIT